MPDTTVKYFYSTMSGAPTLSGSAGSLITVLDACLVNGFGSVTLDSLVVSGNVATATQSGGHGLAMVGDVGPVVRIEGATPSGLNGDWRIASVPGSTTFTFATTGISDQTATGTITAKRAPAGFSKAFSGTNKAAYRADDVASTRLYLRIDDSGTTSARIRGYEDLTDIDTGTGLFPTDAQFSGGGYVYKANAAGRAWALYSDGRAVYFFSDAAGSSTWWGSFAFFDIVSYVAADAYGCGIITTNSVTGPCYLYDLESSSYSWLARGYLQTGGSIASARYSHGKLSSMGSDGQAYPAPADNGAHFWPVEVWEATTHARGMMPGLWAPIHTAATLTHGTVVSDVPQLAGRNLIIQKCNSNNFCAIDIAGPWR